MCLDRGVVCVMLFLVMSVGTERNGGNNFCIVTKYKRVKLNMYLNAHLSNLIVVILMRSFFTKN